MRIRIKICCISSREEARVAVAAGADAIGLVGDMPSGPGVIDDELARDIAATIPPAVGTFLLTRHTEAEKIAGHVHLCGTNTVQIVNHIDPSEYPRITELLPNAVRRVQVIHVEDEGALDLIGLYEQYVHAFLLDSGRPSAAVPELGGTGRAHDWEISRRFVEKSRKPVFLAGGLRPDTVQDAIEKVGPYGVDLCSGVRVEDMLCPDLLSQFISAARRAAP